MATSPNYDVTKEDARQWRTYQDATALAANEAAVANAAAVQAATRATTTVTAISVTPATDTIDLSDGETVQLVTVQTPVDAGAGLTYVSSDPTKATVSATGLVTPVGVGSTTITVSATAAPGVTDTSVITVQA